MANTTFPEELKEAIGKISEAIAAAAEAMKRMVATFANCGFRSNNWRKLHGMPMRRWRHLNNAGYNRRKHL